MKLRYRVLWIVEGIWLWIEWKFLKVISKVLPEYEASDPATCDHKWIVDGCDYEQVAINLMCFDCLSTGIVKNPTEDEWNSVFGASMKKWRGDSEVTWLFQKEN